MKSSHANRGRVWENTLDVIHAGYESTGLACVIRTPPPMRILRNLKAGQFVSVYAKHGPPDYIAISQGIALMMEAKRSAKNRWGLANLHPHQAKRMTEWEKQGGLSLVLLHFAESQQSWVVFWRLMEERWNTWFENKMRGKRASAGTGSLSTKIIDEFGCPFDTSGWLQPAMTFARQNGMLGE